MDATKFTKQDKEVFYLKRHTQAIREHQISVGLMFLYLNGYQVELHYIGEPQVDAAKEVFDELSNEDKTALWSCSTTRGGVWERHQRDALKYGDLDATTAWRAWNRRLSGEVAKTREA